MACWRRGERGLDAALFDGRIDNRADLRAALGDLAGLDDAQVALLGYRKWGDDFSDHIVGDYACAIWDAARRRLVMTVDPAGLRPMYYWQGQGELLFASEPRGLWADPIVPRALDEERLAIWLCTIPTDTERTFYRDVSRVRPGHLAIWQDGQVRTQRWWRPEHVPELRLRCDADYEDALRAGLEEAVRCRLGDSELGRRRPSAAASTARR